MQEIVRYDGPMDTGRTMQRPGGHTARVRSSVHQAVLDLLEEHPWEELSVPLIAGRSGVHQATIYRRWGTMSALLSDVLIEVSPPPAHARHRLVARRPAVLHHRGGQEPRGRSRPADSSGLGAGHAPGEPRATLPAFEAREQQIQVMLDRAAARGETVPTVEQVFEVCAAPLYFRALFTRPCPPRTSAASSTGSSPSSRRTRTRSARPDSP